jgi:hypothetical protein
VKEDKVAAERWFESGLKLHDPMAAYDLGAFYSAYPDHPRDLPRAAELFRQAADAGYVPAMHSLGLLGINHPELKQSLEQSRSLLETAANAGSWKSSIVLGILARDGRGTPIDEKNAYFHFQVAVLQGGAEADKYIKQSMEALGAKIGAPECQTASSDAKAWFDHHSLALLYVYKEGTPNHDFPTAGIAYAPDGSSAGQLLPLSSS